MIFRLSQKLNAKIKAGTLRTLPLHNNPLADWSAHLFLTGRTQYIILSNTKSLYSTVFSGRGITHDSHFIDRALSSIREFMSRGGHEASYQKLIAPASATVYFAKALNRSVTGSMNDLINHAACLLAECELSPFDLDFRVNETFLSALGRSKAAPYGRPRDAFKEMVDRS